VKNLQKSKSQLTKNNYNIAELCEFLSISQATAKNWIKLNKLTPDAYENGKPLFSKSYIENFIKSIQSNSSKILKSRRNKKYVSGAFFYKDYISKTSKNLHTIQNLIDYIVSNEVNLSKTEISSILADCARKLFLSNHQNLDKFTCLIEDLEIDNKIENKLKKEHNKIFQYKYVYEKNEDILGLLFLSLSTLSSRKARGAYFTPTKIVKNMIHNIDFYSNKSDNNKIIDPCCGSGNFLLQIPKSIKLEQIYGNDIDLTSIILTRINMALKYNPEDLKILYKNFTCRNFLFENNPQNYQYIIGNPPWGYNFNQIEQHELSKIYSTAKNKNIESYDVFIEKSINCLNDNGEIFFVLPEAILNVKAHQAIRKFITENTQITYLEYLGNIFNKVQCPSIIVKLQKSKKSFSTSGLKIKTLNDEFVINLNRNLSNNIFNFKMNDLEYEIYVKITSIKNKVYLKNNGVFALGIVTGNNPEFISKNQTSNFEPILKGSDISKYKINKTDNFIKFLPERFQQVAPVKYYRASEKLFYKFISKKLIFAYDNNKLLSLNSCNILIPTFNDLNIKYIMAILNSSIAQYIFEKQFNSLKVLRSHIESIPIPKCSASQQNEIIKLVNKILNCTNSQDFNNLYSEIDFKISNLYGLTNDEFEIVKGSTN
jgi:predicted RNA methylase